MPPLNRQIRCGSTLSLFGYRLGGIVRQHRSHHGDPRCCHSVRRCAPGCDRLRRAGPPAARGARGLVDRLDHRRSGAVPVAGGDRCRLPRRVRGRHLQGAPDHRVDAGAALAGRRADPAAGGEGAAEVPGLAVRHRLHDRRPGDHGGGPAHQRGDGQVGAGVVRALGGHPRLSAHRPACHRRAHHAGGPSWSRRCAGAAATSTTPTTCTRSWCIAPSGWRSSGAMQFAVPGFFTVMLLIAAAAAIWYAVLRPLAPYDDEEDDEFVDQRRTGGRSVGGAQQRPAGPRPQEQPPPGHRARAGARPAGPPPSRRASAGPAWATWWPNTGPTTRRSTTPPGCRRRRTRALDRLHHERPARRPAPGRPARPVDARRLDARALRCPAARCPALRSRRSMPGAPMSGGGYSGAELFAARMPETGPQPMVQPGPAAAPPASPRRTSTAC